MAKDSSLLESAWEKLRQSVVKYRGKPVGTYAACDGDAQPLNYDQVFIRDFMVSALAFLLNDEAEIVKNFLLESLDLQNRTKYLECFKPARGLMPASFKVEEENGEEELRADFGEKAIAKVAPVDSGFWWLLILQSYLRATGDREIVERAECQESIRLILDLSLTPRFSMFPTLLVPDGSFMIDRRMGVYGYPLEIQALFYAALRAADELLQETEENRAFLKAARERMGHLTYHLRKYFWLDFDRLNEIYRYKVEEFSENAINQFNIYPDSIPGWLYEWLPENGGYFVGNLGPARMDFRFFTQGNLLATVTALATPEQGEALMTLCEYNWDDLVGFMPFKLCFPAVKGRDWETMTGSDPKNKPWSYHNGGSWPVLLWLLTAAAIKTNRTDLAEKALDIAEKRLSKDQWPEYYDGRDNRMVGKEARKYQTWSVAGYIVAKTLLHNPERLSLFGFQEPPEVEECIS